MEDIDNETPERLGAGNGKTAKPEDNKTERAKSTIQFPYSDLDAAAGVAKAIFDKAGQQLADVNQVVVWLGHDTADSGAFRVKVATARIFGLVEGDAKQVRLTDIGAHIVDPENQVLAKVQAFLAVPLFKAVFDRYKGKMLPADAVVENEMVGLGVAPKQKDRARQVFQRSAEQAGLFTYGRDRLILPGGVSEAMLAADYKRESLPATVIEPQGTAADNPMISLLLQTLPAPGTEFPAEARTQWFRTVNAIFDKVYPKILR